MFQRGIRGAITVDENTIEAVKEATIELISEMKKQNNYDEKDIIWIDHMYNSVDLYNDY